MKTYKLPCMDHCKSFYGKARVIEHDDGTKKLQSYNTIVCEVTPSGDFIRLWDGYSVTTTRHVNSFLYFLGYTGPQYGGKAFWDALSVNNPVYL